MIYSIIEHLKSTNSRLGKETILEANVDNQLLKSVLVRTFSPHINYYQRKIPAYTVNGDTDLVEALEKLNDLADRKVTGNKAIEFLSNILSSVNARDAFVIECIIKKDLGCGVGIPTINKIWKDLVPTFDVMLCSPMSDKALDKIKYPAMAQLKMDGLRCNVVVNDGTVTFYSRNGKTFDLLGNLEEEFIKAARGTNCVFDGELLVTRDGKVDDRQTGNGILNKANKGTISEEEAALITMTVWDIISYDNWIDGKESMIYIHRYNRLMGLNLGGKIDIVPSTEVKSIDEAKVVYENYYSKGYEGIILKNTDTIWEPKRSKTQIKFKGEETTSLHVVGIQDGNGKYEGQIGSLICESEDGALMVNVGSGLTDEDRLRKDFIGKIIEVKYNAKIKSKGSDTWSLFLPRYVEVRIDRDTADTLDHIK